MSNKYMAALLPKLRFSEFRDAGGWIEKRLGSEGVFLSSLSGKTGSDFDAGEAKFVTYMNVFSNTFADAKALRLVDVKEGESQNKVCRGDVFFTISSETPEEVGLSSVLLEEIDNCYLNSFCTLFRFSESTRPNPIFSGYLLRQPSVRNYFAKKAQGSTRFNLSKDAFKNLPFVLPSPPEQQKIADCLSSLDELLAAQARKVEAHKTHKKGLMQQLFPREGETQPRLRFPEFRDAGEWEEGSISDLATTVMGNAFRSTDFVESGTQVVRIGNLYLGELQLERAPVYLSDTQAEENSKFGVHPLDLLMSMTGTVGKRDYGFVIQVPPDCKPLLLNQRVMKLAPTVKCDPGFLLQLLKSDRLLDAIYSVPGGTKQANLSAQHIKDLSISYPPKSVQQHIALCLSRLDALITLETQELDTLKTHKKGLMQQLFPSAEAVEA